MSDATEPQDERLEMQFIREGWTSDGEHEHPVAPKETDAITEAFLQRFMPPNGWTSDGEHLQVTTDQLAPLTKETDAITPAIGWRPITQPSKELPALPPGVDRLSDLGDADLSGADLTNADLTGATMPDGSIHD